MAFFQPQPWHPGEEKVHTRTHVNLRDDNPTSPFLTPRAAYQVQRYPLLALGTLDDVDRPWCTLWGSDDPPFAQAIAQGVIGIRTVVDASYDPVVEAIWNGKDDGEVVKENGPGRMIGGLSINLEERGRVKLFGRMIAGALSAAHEPHEDKAGEQEGKVGQVQLVVKIEQSLGNCPKYLNKKVITSHTPRPRLVSDSPHLTPEAVNLIAKADMFFISSAHEHEDMDTNHRGGPPNFMRVQQPDDETEGSVIVWPEYSGNNLYQTLGNLETTPRAGLVIPDFDTGDVLYVTGDTEVLVGAEATQVITKSNLAVRLKVTAARFVQEGLSIRGTPTDDHTQGRSPYNPRVRFLTSEKKDPFAKEPGQDAPGTAELIQNTTITPTIHRYRFSLSDPAIFGPWKPGQHVALDFSAALDMGYSHMRDDDPTSLNDDYLRTFTVTSAPGSLGVHGEEFEIMVRKVGSVTGWMTWQRPGMTHVGVRGFGGEFRFDQDGGQRTGFVAAGIGITPLLGQMGGVDVKRLKVLWSVGVKDVGLILDVLQQHPALEGLVSIYLTGDEAVLDNDEGQRDQLRQVLHLRLKLERRRMQKEDLTNVAGQVDLWYICTAPAMRQRVQEWMPGKSILYENFEY